MFLVFSVDFLVGAGQRTLAGSGVGAFVVEILGGAVFLYVLVHLAVALRRVYWREVAGSPRRRAGRGTLRGGAVRVSWAR